LRLEALILGLWSSFLQSELRVVFDQLFFC